MQEVTTWARGSFDAIFGADAGPVELLLRFVVVAMLLIVGWIVASVLKRISRRILKRVGNISRRFRLGDEGRESRYAKAVIQVVASLVFWGVLVFFIALAGRLLHLTIVDRGIEALIAYLPSLGSGIFVMLASIILGGLAFPFITRSAESAGMARSVLLGRVSQVGIVVTGAVIGATELGFDVSFLTNIALVVLGALVGSFALGLALGTPLYVSNVIAARNVRQVLRPGDRIRIDGHDGTLSEIAATHVTLETGNSEIIIPARFFAEKACTRLHEDDHAGG